MYILVLEKLFDMKFIDMINPDAETKPTMEYDSLRSIAYANDYDKTKEFALKTAHDDQIIFNSDEYNKFFIDYVLEYNAINCLRYLIESNDIKLGIASAEAFGKMSQNGAGNVDGGNGGFNPVNIMAGMAIGGALGKNIAGTMDKALNQNYGVTPPPIPRVKFSVAKDGNPTGPFEMETLKEMAISGDLKPETLVWKHGMTEWQRADSVLELKDIFPPVVPK